MIKSLILKLKTFQDNNWFAWCKSLKHQEAYFAILKGDFFSVEVVPLTQQTNQSNKLFLNFGHHLQPNSQHDFKSDPQFQTLTSTAFLCKKPDFRPNIKQVRVKLRSGKYKQKVYLEWFGTYAKRNHDIVG